MTRRRGRALERGFRWLCAGALLLPIAALGVWLVELALLAAPGLDAAPWAAAARLGPGLRASVELVALTAALALPIGVGAAIYLEEYGVERYGERRRLGRLIELSVAQLAGVPSVLYGLLGLELFVRGLALDGRAAITGALTLALVILPLVILAAREALQAVPQGLREAGLALGATRWEVVRRVVLPLALPRMLAGAILAVARALGEAAPLILVAALAFAGGVSDGVGSPAAVLPVRIFAWISSPDAASTSEAAAGVVVLLLAILLLHALALLARARAARRAGGSA